MKRLLLALACFLMPLMEACAFAAYDAKVTVKVIDGDTGLPVEGAILDAGYSVPNGPGEEWGSKGQKDIKGVFDKDGICVIESKCYGELIIGVIKEGYYWTWHKVTFKDSSAVLRRFEPWNQTLELKLMKIGRQVPMYAKIVDKRDFLENGRKKGFDLMEGDWVAPYGKGKIADIVFKFDDRTEEEKKKNPKFYYKALVLNFPNDGDGIQEFLAKRDGSSLRLPREAPLDGYKTLLERRIYIGDNGYHCDGSADQNYIFRVRTQKDKDGNIKSALYGKIHGDFSFNFGNGILRFTYFLNPDSGSRNLEYDGKTNLLKEFDPSSKTMKNAPAYISSYQ